MSLPKSILILGERYRIKIVDGLAENQGCDGSADPARFVICLDSRLLKNKRSLDNVFWHEVAHAYTFVSGLSEILSPQASEQFAQTFSSFMGQLKKQGF